VSRERLTLFKTVCIKKGPHGIPWGPFLKEEKDEKPTLSVSLILYNAHAVPVCCDGAFFYDK